MNNNELEFNTELLHTPYAKQEPYGALSFPVYQNAAFEFETAEQMEAAFIGKTTEHTYSRISNPTVKYFEDRVQRITKAMSVTALNSGMAAISNVFMTLAYAGSNIVTSQHLFGNTYSLLKSTLADFGVEARFCDFTNTEEVRKQIDENTCAVFCEIISNPQLEVVDLKAISTVANTKQVPFVVDTTLVPFCAFCASDWGIDVEVVSSTKYISGGATSLGGLILDYGVYNWSKSPKLSKLAESAGRNAFTVKLKKEIHRNLGAYMNPQVAYAQSLGLETLSLRYYKAVQTCSELAQRLQNLSGIESVNYPQLIGNKFHALSVVQFNNTAGAMFTFELDSREKCFDFLNKLRVIKRATNLFDNKTLAIHPASTIYGPFTHEERQKMNVSDKTIRVSVGLEECNNLFEDIKQALKDTLPLSV